MLNGRPGFLKSGNRKRTKNVWQMYLPPYTSSIGAMRCRAAMKASASARVL